MRRPSQSIEEYRELTFVIGSPIVFQTAPPQPASKARITCSPQLVGGPDASQNGLGQRIPAKTVVRSAMGGLRGNVGPLQEFGHSAGGALAIGHRVHHFASAVDAVAAGEIARMGGLAGGAIHRNRPLYNLDAARLAQRAEE